MLIHDNPKLDIAKMSFNRRWLKKCGDFHNTLNNVFNHNCNNANKSQKYFAL